MGLLLSTASVLKAEEPVFSEASFPKKCVGSPEFDTKDGKQSAGTASLAKVDETGPVYLLSVRHLLGPMGGFAKETPSEEVGAFVKSIKLEGLFGGHKKFKVEGFSWPTVDDKNTLKDLLVFKTDENSAEDAALISPVLPAIGDSVWVVAHVRGGVPEGQYIHKATVTYSVEGNYLVAEFENPGIVTSGASGAPVFDASGKIVGVYSGHSKKGGKIFASIIPSGLILQVIKGK